METAEHKLIRIVLADDHPLIRTALRHLLEQETDFEVVGEAGTGSEAVDLTEKWRPDVVIMDISMPGMNGIEATKLIRTFSPATSVLILTVHTDVETIFSILKAGASGYLVKSIFGPEVIRTIRALMDGDLVLAPGISAQILDHLLLHEEDPEPVPEEPDTRLSRKELEVLTLAARGLSNKEIGARLGMTEATIKGYFVDIFRHLNVRSRTEAIFVSMKSGILALDDLV